MSSNSKTLLVLGATSAVAHAYLRLICAQPEYTQILLLGRNPEKLERVRQDIDARSSADVKLILADLGRPDQVHATLGKVKNELDGINECLIAYGMLGDLETLQVNPTTIQNLLETNFVSVALWLEALATEFESQKRGHAVVIGSVAGDRGRQSNYLYGATKCGLERVSEGLSHRFASQRNIHFTCIKPGFIESPMTAHLEPSGPLWASPEKIARIIRRAVKTKRVRVYAPWVWRYILLVIRALPVPIFHRTNI
ncbi:MAG: SDR family NAD(P)-dependent oxidoreductase [Henriciella sp.]|nr:SDR family NAD(P)-dependent oxidoreductase [Henriciella sp.]